MAVPKEDPTLETMTAPKSDQTPSNPIEAAWMKIRANEKGHVVFCVVGIVGCLMLYGVLQVRGLKDGAVLADKQACCYLAGTSRATR